MVKNNLKHKNIPMDSSAFALNATSSIVPYLQKYSNSNNKLQKVSV